MNDWAVDGPPGPGPGPVGRLAEVAFDGPLVADGGVVGVEPGGPACAPLAQQVPGLVEGDLEAAQPLPLRRARLAPRLLLEQLVLLARQLVDPVERALVLHEDPPSGPDAVRPRSGRPAVLSSAASVPAPPHRRRSAHQMAAPCTVPARYDAVVCASRGSGRWGRHEQQPASEFLLTPSTCGVARGAGLPAATLISGA